MKQTKQNKTMCKVIEVTTKFLILFSSSYRRRCRRRRRIISGFNTGMI